MTIIAVVFVWRTMVLTFSVFSCLDYTPRSYDPLALTNYSRQACNPGSSMQSHMNHSAHNGASTGTTVSLLIKKFLLSQLIQTLDNHNSYISMSFSFSVMTIRVDSRSTIIDTSHFSVSDMAIHIWLYYFVSFLYPYTFAGIFFLLHIL